MESLGEALLGYELVKSTYEIHYLVPVQNKIVCKKRLDVNEVAQFSKAVEQDYMFEFFIGLIFFFFLFMVVDD